MSDPRYKKYKAVKAEVNEVLYNDWAPIGFVGALPKDEYETYAVRVVSMLASGASELEIEKHLLHVESKIIGLDENPECARKVAGTLVSFGEKVR